MIDGLQNQSLANLSYAQAVEVKLGPSVRRGPDDLHDDLWKHVWYSAVQTLYSHAFAFPW